MADEVVLRIRGDSTELQRAVGAARSSVQGLNVTVSQLGGSRGPAQLTSQLNSMGSSLSQLGSRMTALFTVPIVGGLAAAAKSSADFESAFANVRKTIGNVPELGQIREGIRGLSRELPQSVEELANMAALGGQFGISSKGILDFTRTVAALDVAVDGIDAAQAAEGLAQLRTASGAGEADISRMASALVHLGNNGASSEAQILELSQRLAGAGRTAGLAVPEIMGIAATLANLGINAEAGGTAMSRTIQQMLVAVKQGGDGLEAFARVAGTTAEGFAKVFNERPSEAIARFIEGLGRIKNGGGDVISALKGLDVETQRQLSMLLQLTTASSNFANTQGQVREQIKLADAAYVANNKHLEEAAEKNKTLYNVASRLWNTLKDVVRPLGDDVVKALEGMVDWLQKATPKLDAMVQAFRDMPDAIKVGVLGTVGLAAVSPIAILVAGQVLQAAANVLQLVNAFQKLRDAQVVGGLLGIGGAATTAAGGAAGGGLLGMGGAVATLTTLIGGVAIAGTFLGALTVTVGVIQGLSRELQKSQDGMTAWGATWRATLLTAAQSSPFLSAILAPGGGDAMNPRAPAKSAAGGFRVGGGSPNPMGSVPTPFSFSGPGAGAPAAGGAQAPVDGLRLAAKAAADYAKALRVAGVENFKLAAREVELGRSVKDAAGTYGLQEDHLDRYIHLQKEGQKAASERAEADKQQAEERARNVGELIDDVLKVSAAIDDASEKAGDKYLRDAMDRADKEMKALGRANEEHTKVTRDRIEDEEALEADSLEKRLRLVKREFDDRREELDRFSPFYQENVDSLAAMEQRATAAATQAWVDHVAEVKRQVPTIGKVFSDVLKNVPALIQQALTGGGGIGGAVEAIASQLGSGILQNLFTSPTGFGQKLTQGIGSLFGNNAASAFGSMLGPIGAALGALAGPLLGKLSDKIGALFNRNKGRDVIEEFGEGFEGGMDGLHRSLLAFGEAGERAWVNLTQRVGRNDAEGARAAVAAVKELLDRGKAAAEAMNGELGGLLESAQGVGYVLPEGMQAYIDKLERAGLLTAENAAQLRLMTGDGEVDFDRLKGLADKFGVSLDALGPKFRQGEMDKTAKGIIEAFEELVAGGGDFNGVLAGMKDEISEVAQHSIKFGTEIPENMRPWIEKLIASGELLDENGEKITDIGQLHFGETIQTGLQNIVDKLQEMIDLFERGLPGSMSESERKLRENQEAFRRWRESARSDIDEVRDGIDGVSFGSSPGGIKEIPLKLTESARAMRDFSRDGVRQMGDLRRVIDATSGVGLSGLGPGMAAAAAGGSQVFNISIRGKDDRELAHYVREVGQDMLTERRWNVPSDVVIDVTQRSVA